MKQLLLMRHAKSSWDDPLVDDHDRVLSPRGIRAATAMGAWLAKTNLVPDCVVSSTANRCVQTWEIVGRALPQAGPPTKEENLYMTSPFGLLKRLKNLRPECQVALLINHEPAIGGLAELLAQAPVAPDCRRAFGRFSTAGIAQFEWAIENWHDLAPGIAQFTRFQRPKDLDPSL